MNIYLVRHTEYANPKKIFAFNLPFYLTENGRNHAKRIGEWFKEKKLNEIPIYSSPIVRAVQTAEIIASFTNSYVAIDNDLRETESKELVGKPLTDKFWEIEPKDPTREPIQTVGERGYNVLQKHIEDSEECMLVSHGDLLTALYFQLIERELPEYLWTPEFMGECVQKGEIIQLILDDKKIVNIERINV
ncbi:MAG TPA: histidine phosphatase family protein [Candidatus Nitrosocosmicus sp.]|nr:histidine phosphatase family protein [Candidatus Nitrosocosmicus sp.]